MLRSLLVLLLVLPSLSFGAQTLLDIRTMESGGYGAPDIKLTSLRGSNHLLVGGKGGWIVNHHFILGAAGYGLATQLLSDDPLRQRLNFGYGGVTLEYVIFPDLLVHPSLGVLVGAGGVGYDGSGNGSAFFVAEPTAQVTMNVTQWFRIGVHAGYRAISGADALVTRNVSLSGWAAGLGLAFGYF